MQGGTKGEALGCAGNSKHIETHSACCSSSIVSVQSALMLSLTIANAVGVVLHQVRCCFDIPASVLVCDC